MLKAKQYSLKHFGTNHCWDIWFSHVLSAHIILNTNQYSLKYFGTDFYWNIPFSCVLSVQITLKAKEYSLKYSIFICIECTYYAQGKTRFSELFWHKLLLKYSIFMFIECPYYSEGKPIFHFHMYWGHILWRQNNILWNISASTTAEIFHFHLYWVCTSTLCWRRSLLSSTDSSWNPAESRQFPEFRRNQIWQRGLPNWSNDSDWILNRIQILLEWFLKSPGRNEFPEQGRMESMWNHCLLITSKSSVGVCWWLIWASSTNNSTLSQPPPLSTMRTHLAHHHHQRRPPITTHNTDTPHNKYDTPQKSKNDAATPHHRPQLANKHLQHCTTVPCCCQRHGKWWMMMLVIVRHLCSRWVLTTTKWHDDHATRTPLAHYTTTMLHHHHATPPPCEHDTTTKPLDDHAKPHEQAQARCHVALSDVATRWWMMTVVIVCRCHLFDEHDHNKPPPHNDPDTIHNT